jgi:hypothetical protein
LYNKAASGLFIVVWAHAATPRPLAAK